MSGGEDQGIGGVVFPEGHLLKEMIEIESYVLHLAYFDTSVLVEHCWMLKMLHRPSLSFPIWRHVQYAHSFRDEQAPQHCPIEKGVSSDHALSFVPYGRGSLLPLG